MKQLFVYTDIVLLEAEIMPVISFKEKVKWEYFFFQYCLFTPVLDAKGKSWILLFGVCLVVCNRNLNKKTAKKYLVYDVYNIYLMLFWQPP